MYKEILIKDLIKIANGKLISGNENLIIDNLNKDTRELKEGDIYIAITGENFDGNKFIEQAFKLGAIACICDNLEYLNFDYSNKTIVYVENTIKAIQQLAKYKRDLYDIPVIGITGSVGKTSTKDIVASVISEKYKVLKTEGNYNNEIGLPLTILKLKDHNAMVLEMGMSELGEISLLSNIAKPTTALITNVGTAHIANLGNRENILKAKLEIIEGLKENGKLIINNDNDLLNKEKDKIKTQIITVGINNKSDYEAINIKDETTFDILHHNKKCNITNPISGKAYIYNSLMAYALGKEYNLTDEQIENGIKTFKLSKSRLEKHTLNNNITIFDDTYNASLDSMKSSLSFLEKQPGKRKIAILGDILEVGSYAEKIHREIGNYIKNINIDCVYTVGDNSKYIIKELKEELILTKHFNTNNEIINFLKNNIKENDTILLKASNGMKFYDIVLELLKM